MQAKRQPAIRYTITPTDPKAHRFTVRCDIPQPAPNGQRLALPAWIPGSYLIRDFARHIVEIHAESAGKAVALTQLDKHSWHAAPIGAGATLSVICEIHAWDLSVRGAHLDETHGFFNGTSVFLRVLGQEDAPLWVDIRPPQHATDWRVATGLEPARGEPGSARHHGFGLYRADNYDELIDHPVEMGRFTLATFDAGGVPHEIAITGQHDADIDRLTADLTRICNWQIGFFGQPAPMQRYTFLVTAVGEGYGGLEHRASTALLCSRRDLPFRGMTTMTEGYRSFLGLCSHEYFHTWNVKRIRPAAFMPYDLERENYTRLLWAFEGITSYYDDLALLRSGVITLDDWLTLLGKTIGNVARTPGRLRQSLADSSFNAWSKFYRPDDNTPNAVVSYYAKGALVALALDLTLRRKTAGRVSLDDVMRALWTRHGLTGVGVEEDGIRRLAEELSGHSLRRFFADFVDGTVELPLARLLAGHGIRLDWTAARTPSLGVKTTAEGELLRLTHVYDGGAAQAAGLAAGDLLVAIDGLRVTPTTLEAMLARRQAGEMLRVHTFRRDELREVSVKLDAPDKTDARLSVGKTGEARVWPHKESGQRRA
ncbi:M61 family metallopeptidase [Propionivibrio dicarboxylicus]|uniref:Predicted metalloprotease, contains C-terminal PDZ domain n=1 Tax=Propionivibrio dicarboxylicus TaxID=83767 RepID=A0A1G8FPJ6_9RHOO|nr:PDZ domain-containing protein [Propionivibrio dicarboxylicus]SDH84034.1 Predicted metalloprotease, contains C-terminal PDZ domain [Propionivibrio dicarboxylicus]